jgi:hypothetical protein
VATNDEAIRVWALVKAKQGTDKNALAAKINALAYVVRADEVERGPNSTITYDIVVPFVVGTEAELTAAKTAIAGVQVNNQKAVATVDYLRVQSHTPSTPSDGKKLKKDKPLKPKLGASQPVPSPERGDNPWG